MSTKRKHEQSDPCQQKADPCQQKADDTRHTRSRHGYLLDEHLDSSISNSSSSSINSSSSSTINNNSLSSSIATYQDGDIEESKV